MAKVFLGGTCNGSEWRDRFIPMLDVEYFNPIVTNWNEKAKSRELRERKECSFLLYVITPKISGVYSIAEVVDDSNKRPHKTIFCVLEEDKGIKFNNGQLRSLNAVSEMVKRNGGHVFENLKTVARYINKKVLDE